MEKFKKKLSFRHKHPSHENSFHSSQIQSFFALIMNEIHFKIKYDLNSSSTSLTRTRHNDIMISERIYRYHRV